MFAVVKGKVNVSVKDIMSRGRKYTSPKGRGNHVVLGSAAGGREPTDRVGLHLHCCGIDRDSAGFWPTGVVCGGTRRACRSSSAPCGSIKRDDEIRSVGQVWGNLPIRPMVAVAVVVVHNVKVLR